MNILAFLDRLSTPVGAATTPRRLLLHQLGKASARLVAASLPVTLAAVSTAQARPTDTALDVIFLLLKLEQLQVAFYTQANSSATLSAFRTDLAVLLAHQQGHVTFLQQFLTNAGVAAPPTPAFDFSGQRGNVASPVLFPAVFTNISNFLQLAQQLEDASTAIYKGQAPYITDKLMLTGILRMQSVEARHAAHIRTLRRTYESTLVKSWPSRADTTPAALVQVPSVVATTPATTTSIYSFENNEVQLASASRLIPFATLLTDTKLVQSNSLAEAFDEPLPTAQARALLNIFG